MPNSPDSDHLDQPDYWRKLAAEMRALGAQMTDPVAKQKMREAAMHYEVIAERIEMRDGFNRPPSRQTPSGGDDANSS